MSCRPIPSSTYPIITALDFVSTRPKLTESWESSRRQHKARSILIQPSRRTAPRCWKRNCSLALITLEPVQPMPYRTPVPPQRWHLTTLSPFFSRPLPSQFLHFCFFLMLGPFALAMMISRRRGSRLNVSPEADVPGRRDAIAVNSMHGLGACRHSPAHGL